MTNFASNIKFSDEEVTAQSGTFDFDQISTGAVTLLTFYISCVSGKSVPVELFKGLGSFERTKKSFMDIVALILNMLEKAVNWLRVEFLDLPSLRFLATNNTKIDEYFQEVSKIYELQRIGKFYNNETTFGKICGLLSVGKKIYTEMPKDRNTEGASRLLYSEIQRLEKLKKVYEDSHIDLKGFRMETVGVFLRGGPGTGKSIVMQHVSHAFLAAILDAETYDAFKSNPADFVYNRFFETVYWDKYSLNSMVTMFDDFGQARDVQGTPDNEIMNFMRAVNSFRYDLHMAHLDEKGLTAFNSKLAIATTNLESFRNVESINNVEALQRRIALDVVVCPRQEYCTDETRNKGPWKRKFDRLKMPQGVNICSATRFIPSRVIKPTTIDPSMQEYHVLAPNGDPTGEVLHFRELVVRIIQLYERNRAWYMAQKLAVSETEEYFRKYDTEKLKAQAFLPSDLVQRLHASRVASTDDSSSDFDYDRQITYFPDRKSVV